MPRYLIRPLVSGDAGAETGIVRPAIWTTGVARTAVASSCNRPATAGCPRNPGGPGESSVMAVTVRSATEPAELVSNRWIASISVANLGLFMAYFGSLAVLLPNQVQDIVGPVHKVVAFGWVTGLGALVAAVVNPLAGAFSDRTAGRFGRPWVLCGALASAASLALLTSLHTVGWAIVGWCLAQAGLNTMQAGIAASVPDRVPVPQRGVVSAWLGAPQCVYAQGGCIRSRALPPSPGRRPRSAGPATTSALSTSRCARWTTRSSPGRPRPATPGRTTSAGAPLASRAVVDPAEHLLRLRIRGNAGDATPHRRSPVSAQLCPSLADAGAPPAVSATSPLLARRPA